MTWELVYTVPLTQTLRPIITERVFNKSTLIVEAIAVDAKPTWYKAGLLYPLIDIADVGRVKSFGQPINLDKQLIKFEQLENIDFQLEFYAHSWIPTISLNFWEDDMPVIDLTPDQPVINPGIATTKNAVAVSIAGTSNTPVKLLPASTTNTRKHATFYNPSTKRNLYIDTDATINTASAIAKVAPGKVYISDIPNWQGEYWGMLDLSDTVATNVAVEEYI